MPPKSPAQPPLTSSCPPPRSSRAARSLWRSQTPAPYGGVVRQLNVALPHRRLDLPHPHNLRRHLRRRHLVGHLACCQRHRYAVTLRAHADLAGGTSGQSMSGARGWRRHRHRGSACHRSPPTTAWPCPRSSRAARSMWSTPTMPSSTASNRNLHVQQISTRRHCRVLPTNAIVSFDIGQRQPPPLTARTSLPAREAVSTNGGALRLTWPSPNLTDRLTVRAQPATSCWWPWCAQMIVRVDGVVVASADRDIRRARRPCLRHAAPGRRQPRRCRVRQRRHRRRAGPQPARALPDGRHHRAAAQRWTACSWTPASAWRPTTASASVWTTTQSLLTANGALRGKWPSQPT